MGSRGERLSAGDSAAFADLYQECADRLHHYLVVRLGGRDAADEVLQEVFVRLVQQRSRLAAVTDLVAYTFVVARNEAIRWAERRGRERLHRQAITGVDLFVAQDGEAVEMAETIAVAMRSLPADLAEVIELKLFANLTFREIAVILEAPQGTVATRYRTALARLKEWFARQPS